MMMAASNILKVLHLQKTPIGSSSPISFSKTIFFHSSSSSSLSVSHLSHKNPSPPHQQLAVLCCAFPKSRDDLFLSSPPSTREEAISQVKFSLSSLLRKPLNNPLSIPTRKLKKLSQQRYRVEIPLKDDDSPTSLTNLAFEVLASLPLTITKKGSKRPATVLILWPNRGLTELAREAFISSSSNSTATTVTNSDFDSVTDEVLNSCDFAVFMAPDASQLQDIKGVTNSLNPKPVVLFNPKWGFDQETEFDKLGGFVGSFDVVYSFMGLEVKGIIKRRKGVVFRCVKDGVLESSGEGWVVMVEDDEDNKGRLKVVSRFKRRPTIAEVESVLYNVMAVNSPVTKSVKFLKDLASNLTGKKTN